MNRGKFVRRMLPWVFFTACLGAWVIFFIGHAGAWVDSDMSSEMILAKELADNGGFLLSKNWLYSTEIRILHQQAVFSILFRFLENWRVVRIVGTLLLYAGYLVAWHFLCRRAGIRRAFPVTAGLLMLPFSEAYGYIMLFGAFYIPHMILIFIILGILLGQLRNRAQSKALLCVGAALSLIAGMGGPRLILILFMPVGAVALCRAVAKGVRQDRRFFGAAAVYCAAALCGYAVNRFILSGYYSFESFGSLQIELAGMKRIREVVRMWLYALSDRAVTGFTLLAAILFFIAFCGWAVMLKNRKTVPENRGALAMYGFFCVLFLCGVYLVTNMACVDWYFIPAVIFLIPTVVMAAGRWRFKRVFYGILTLIMVICGVRGYVNFTDWRLRTGRVSTDLPNVAEFLTENGYDNGYASFWSANVLTELTDGQVDVWATTLPIPGTREVNDALFETDNLYKWLQLTDHWQNRPEGSVFLLLTARENAAATADITALPVLYQSSDYIVYDATEKVQ